MIETKIKLPDLVEPGILQEIQNSFAAKNNLGLAIYDEQDTQITTSNLNFLPDKPDNINCEILNLLLQPHFENINIKNNLQNDNTLYLSFLNQEFIHAAVPVIFQEQLMLKICLILKTDNKKNTQEIINEINQNLTIDPSLSSIIDKSKPEPSNEFILLLDNLKNQVLLFLESGWQRAKVQLFSRHRRISFLTRPIKL